MIKLKDDVKEMSMIELSHNQVFVMADGWAWYRDYDREISCLDLARELLSGLSCVSESRSATFGIMSDHDFNEYLFDSLDESMGEGEYVVALLYRALWSMAEVRESLKEAYDIIRELKQDDTK